MVDTDILHVCNIMNGSNQIYEFINIDSVKSKTHCIIITSNASDDIYMHLLLENIYLFILLNIIQVIKRLMLFQLL